MTANSTRLRTISHATASSAVWKANITTATSGDQQRAPELAGPGVLGWLWLAHRDLDQQQRRDEEQERRT